MNRWLLAGVMVVLVGIPTAFAADIYINGQPVRGITNLTLENCTVTFNGKGDVYINSPDYKVLPTAATGDQTQQNLPPTSALENRYFLFTQTSNPGQVPYLFEVWVNDQKVKEFTSAQLTLTVELTLYLKKGQNRVEIRSRYQADQPSEPTATFEIRLGRGKPVEGSLEINEVLMTYTRKGSDQGDGSDLFQIEAK
jgi:hypothetical protein